MYFYGNVRILSLDIVPDLDVAAELFAIVVAIADQLSA